MTIASLPHYFSQVPGSVQVKIGTPRIPKGGPRDAVLTHLEGWTDPVTGHHVDTMEDVQGAYWMVDPEIGEIRIPGPVGQIEAWPSPTVRPALFMETLYFRWMPSIFTVWGWQVLRASGVANPHTSGAVAFVGSPGCGKSTLGFALGELPGWRQLHDDALAFDTSIGHAQLLPIPNRVHLQSPASEYFGHVTDQDLDLDWPSSVPWLDAVYLLEPSSHGPDGGRITELKMHEAFTEVLDQAHNLTMMVPDLQDLQAESFVQLLSDASIFRIEYRKDISQMSSLTKLVDQHALTTLSEVAAQREGRPLSIAPGPSWLEAVPDPV